jgi:hypothetical protein
MKKSLSFLLIFVFIYGITGVYLNFEIEQNRIKEEVKASFLKTLKINQLILIKITSQNNSKIRWTEEGHEFRYEGDLYDVVRIKNAGDTTFFYCFNDEKENNLFSNLDKLVKDQTDHSKSKTQIKKAGSNYFFHEVNQKTILPERVVYFLQFRSNYTLVYPPVLTPPPRNSGYSNYTLC